MKYLLLSLAALALWAQEPGVVSGTVVRSPTGEPVPRVSLTLNGMAGAVFETRSDAEGRFAFPAVPVGSYTLLAERNGYLQTLYSTTGSRSRPTTLEIKAGERLPALRFPLLPQSVLSGRVVDEENEPVDRAMIQLAVLRNGQFSGQHHTQTNDLGEFRLSGLAPDKYLIIAQREPRSSAVRKRIYLPTYYPGTLDPNAATFIELKAGQESTNVRLTLQQGAVFQVRGRLAGDDGPYSRYNLTLFPSNEPNRIPTFGLSMGWRGGLTPNGTFAFSSVPPGTYHLFLVSHEGGPPVELAKLPITVSQSDLEDIVITVQPPLQVRGRIRFDHEATLSLAQTKIGLGPFQTTVDAQGAFEIPRVSRQRLPVWVSPIPGTYLKQVLVGGVELIGREADFSTGATEVQITLGTRPPHLTGSVKRESAEQDPGIVVMVPEGQRLKYPFHQNPFFPVGPNGQFAVDHIAPGKYRALSIEISGFRGFLSAEILAQLEARATSLELAEGETKSIVLPQLSRADLAALGLDFEP